MAAIPLTDADLVKAVKENDIAAVREAYARVFQGPLGRLVLSLHLYDCGVGAQIGGEDNRYKAGWHDAALDLADKAGFGAAAMAVATLTGNLENLDDDAMGSAAPFDPDDLLC